MSFYKFRIFLFGREERVHSFNFTVHLDSGTQAGNHFREEDRRIFFLCIQGGAHSGVEVGVLRIDYLLVC